MLKRSLLTITKLSKYPTTSSLLYHSKFTYLSPIDKPILSLTLKSFHQFSAQLMTIPFIQSGGAIHPQISVLIGAFVFKIGIQLICTMIRAFRFKNKNDLSKRDYVEERYKKDDRQLVKWIDKVLVLDTVRDMQFYGIVKQDINRTIWKYYRPSVLISSVINCYFCLNFMRGVYLITVSPQFSVFCQSTVYLSNLILHDNNFITPIMIIVINFLLFKTSRHPFLIHFNHPGNIFHCINCAFMSGLIFVPLPGIYSFAYMGLGIGHLVIRLIKYAKDDIGRYLRKLIK